MGYGGNKPPVVINIGVPKADFDAHKKDYVSVKAFGAHSIDEVGYEAFDSTTALQNAVDEGKDVLVPYRILISAPITITKHGQKIYGYSKGDSTYFGSQIVSVNDIEFFKVYGWYTLFEGLNLYCSNVSHSKKHIQSYDSHGMQVVNCRIDGMDSSAIGGGIGYGDGLGGYGSLMGIVDKCILNHASIDIQSSDIHITNSWVWANSRPYGIKINGSCANISLIGVDIVPPVKTVVGRKAGVYITGAVIQPKVIGCYFDGVSSLATSTGILVENGVLAPLITDCHFNLLNDNALVLDSVLCPIASNNTFYNNNGDADGSVDILLQETFVQDMEKPLIQGNTHIQTTAIVGTTGPAIKVATGTTKKRMRIIDNTIQQPGTGGGYDNIEILLVDGYFASPVEGSLKGNAGTRRVYGTSGSKVIPVNDNYETILHPTYAMAYEPRVDQYVTNIVATDPTSIDYSLVLTGSASNFAVRSPASHIEYTLHYNVSL